MSLITDNDSCTESINGWICVHHSTAATETETHLARGYSEQTEKN
jgi:hypothetical protein